MGLKIGVVGSVTFANAFIPLFKAHPLVDEVVLAELDAEKRRRAVERHSVRRSFASLDELLQGNVDAVALITQRHLHAPQARQALQAGKHVFCAVPTGQSLEDIAGVIDEVARSGLIYMTAETSYYYPTTLYCLQQFQEGHSGRVVYGEASYMHDMMHDFYTAFQSSGGKTGRGMRNSRPCTTQRTRPA